jgi:thiaminase/transcriptional activator TenA
MTFSAELWDRGAAKVYEEILRHPFITGLTDGTLDHSAFRYFILQDSHYLRAYSRALTLVAARATEQGLHSELLVSLGLESADVDAAGSRPTTTAYMSYLTAVCATGTYAEAVAAVLPCYWIYRDVGRELLKRSSPDLVYRQWIETYGSEEFDAVVESVLAVTDRLGSEVGPGERERCHRHFSTTTRYEWMFWDAAYHELDWPVG